MGKTSKLGAVFFFFSVLQLSIISCPFQMVCFSWFLLRLRIISIEGLQMVKLQMITYVNGDDFFWEDDWLMVNGKLSVFHIDFDLIFFSTCFDGIFLVAHTMKPLSSCPSHKSSLSEGFYFYFWNCSKVQTTLILAKKKPLKVLFFPKITFKHSGYITFDLLCLLQV